jgi:ribosomal protein S5
VPSSNRVGIKDISAQVHGSTHPATVAQAFLRVLQRQKSPEDVAIENGLRLVDVIKLYDPHNGKYHIN